jgi:myo-inositol-1(or 4)-monophosphatase
MPSRLELAAAAVDSGAELARAGFRTAVAVETKTGPLDSVTELDREVQRRVVERLRDTDPSVCIVAEEDLPDFDTRTTVPDEGFAWVLDPIDGTNNFVAGNRCWGVSLGAVEDGDPVLAVNEFPALGDRYVAGDGTESLPTRNDDPCSVSDRTDPATFTVNPVFGVSEPHREMLSDYVAVVTDRFGDMRRFGCAQLALSAVAAGELEAAVSGVRLNAWDTAAGVYLVRRAGGVVTDVDGERWRPGSTGLIASNGEAHDTLVDAVEAV